MQQCVMHDSMHDSMHGAMHGGLHVAAGAMYFFYGL